MTICVVITTYNRAHLLAATIDDLRAQTESDFELLISDDCSDDDTPQLCNRLANEDPRIRYQRNETRLGMPGNLNAAIRATSRPYVANLHDDDPCHPRLLERWKSALDSCPDAAFVFNAYRLEGANEKSAIASEDLPPCFPGTVLLQDIYFKRWRFASPVWGSVMARRSAYDAVGLFDPQFGFWADVDMWMRLAEQFSVAYVDEPLITLASRDRAPRLVNDSGEQRVLEKIWLQARLRHYPRRSAKRWLELARHYVHVASSRSYWGVLGIRARLLRRQ